MEVRAIGEAKAVGYDGADIEFALHIERFIERFYLVQIDNL